jgi:hypothetical protein
MSDRTEEAMTFQAVHTWIASSPAAGAATAAEVGVTDAMRCSELHHTLVRLPLGRGTGGTNRQNSHWAGKDHPLAGLPASGLVDPLVNLLLRSQLLAWAKPSGLFATLPLESVTSPLPRRLSSCSSRPPDRMASPSDKSADSQPRGRR